MAGGFCLNAWLNQEGYLVLKQSPQSVQPLSLENIDWDNTTAWGAGGYYGRIFLNVRNREPKGIIKQTNYHTLRDTIREKLQRTSMNSENMIYYPEDVYRQVNGAAPDLIVYFDNLNLRSIGSIGHPELMTPENDDGNDYANHATNGIYIISDSEHSSAFQKPSGDLPITSVFDLLLDYFQPDPNTLS